MHSFGGTDLFAISEVDACTTSSSVGMIQTFFAQGLPTNGWAQSQTYPYDGGRQMPCGDQYCWSKDNAPRYVSLEKVTDAGQGHVTYHLRLASPPAAPTGQSCAASGFAINWHGAPLPPLSTLFGGSSTSYAGDVSVCSAGTSASIDTFFTTELPKTNWKQQNPPSSNRCYTSGLSAWWNGTVYRTMRLRATAFRHGGESRSPARATFVPIAGLPHPLMGTIRACERLSIACIPIVHSASS